MPRVPSPPPTLSTVPRHVPYEKNGGEKTSRSRNGCLTCRIRRKKCTELKDPEGFCEACSRLGVECLGYAEKRPVWMKDHAKLEACKKEIGSWLAGRRSQSSKVGHLSLAHYYGDEVPELLHHMPKVHRQGRKEETLLWTAGSDLERDKPQDEPVNETSDPPDEQNHFAVQGSEVPLLPLPHHPTSAAHSIPHPHPRSSGHVSACGPGIKPFSHGGSLVPASQLDPEKRDEHVNESSDSLDEPEVLRGLRMPPLHPHPHFTFFTQSISCPLSGNEPFTDASPSLVTFREDGPQARIIAREAEAAEPSGFHHQRSDRMVPSSPISFPPLGNPQEQFTTNAHNSVPPFPGSAGSRSLTFDPRPKSIINAAEDEHLAGVHRGLLIGESEQLFKFYDSVPAGTGLTDSARPNNYVNQSLSDSKLPYLNTSLPSPQALTSSLQTEPHSVAPTPEYDLILRITSLLNRIQPPGLTGLLPDSFIGAPAFSPLGQDIRGPHWHL